MKVAAVNHGNLGIQAIYGVCGLIFVSLLGGLLVSCSSTGVVSNVDATIAPIATRLPVSSCEALVGQWPASVIGIASGPVTLRSAQAIAAVSLSVNAGGPTPASLINPAKPDYCQLQGSIAPIDPSAPNIEFQINLPTAWNGRSVQYGGGGFNGVLINALGLVPSGRFDLPAPLQKGFVTYGTDSGHQNKPNTPPQVFALNDEALDNFTHLSYKKVRDVAVEAMKRYYGKGPNKLYYVGSSEGGREGMLVAQRYPNDFDGVFSRVPVLNWVGLQMFGARSGNSLWGANWINPAKVKLVHEATLTMCDALDGVADGIVSDFQACEKRFDPTALRCPNGGDSGDQCLSDGQVNAVKLLRSPLKYPYPMANGVTEYPGYAMGGEGTVGTGPTGGWMSWWTGRSAPSLPAAPTNSITWFYGAGAVQYFFAKDANYDVRNYKAGDFAERTLKISQNMDATNPDLSAFKSRGGKLIMQENIADYAQSANAGIQYFKSVQSKMGEGAVKDFARLYMAPGVDHVGSGAPSNIDMLDLLVDWVERGHAPGTKGELTLLEQETTVPFKTIRARPLCEFPLVPRYKAGDINMAASFACEK
jgi:Tannase and feruloyl esterase